MTTAHLHSDSFDGFLETHFLDDSDDCFITPPTIDSLTSLKHIGHILLGQQKQTGILSELSSSPVMATTIHSPKSRFDYYNAFDSILINKLFLESCGLWGNDFYKTLQKLAIPPSALQEEADILKITLCLLYMRHHDYQNICDSIRTLQDIALESPALLPDKKNTFGFTAETACDDDLFLTLILATKAHEKSFMKWFNYFETTIKPQEA